MIRPVVGSLVYSHIRGIGVIKKTKIIKPLDYPDETRYYISWTDQEDTSYYNEQETVLYILEYDKVINNEN